MVKECMNRYDSKEWIYMEWMDKDEWNNAKYICSMNKESKHSIGMWRCNIKIRCKGSDSTYSNINSEDKYSECDEPDSDIEM